MSWRGSIFSIFSAQHADWQGAGYGPLLETPSVRDFARSVPHARRHLHPHALLRGHDG